MTPEQRVQAILDEAVGSDLTSWEKHEFLPSVRLRAVLSEKQEGVLRQIEKKIFGEDADE
jgi:hypothetical protein